MNQVYSRVALCLMASVAFASESKASTQPIVDMVAGETKIFSHKDYLQTVSCVASLDNESAEARLVNRNRVNGINTLFSGATLNLPDQVIQCGKKQLADTGFSVNLICVVDSALSWVYSEAYTRHTVALEDSEIADGKLTTAGRSRLADICKSVSRVVSHIRIRNITN